MNDHSFENISRRGFLKTVAGASAFVAAQGVVNALTNKSVEPRKNLILVLTDQERSVQWFPEGWAEENLPAMTQLKNTGVTFQRASCNAAMCTPSRNTLFTGLFPAQHESYHTLTEDFEQSLSEHQLDPTIPNLATVLTAAGYDVYYKGKWHLSKSVEGAADETIEDDITRYGFQGWNPPDAGQDVKIENYGGGTADNDQRYADDAVAFLQDRIANPNPRPFCLVVSLVNPHDVLGYPTNSGTGGYSPADLIGPIELPPSVDENLFTNFKPDCQGALLASMAFGFGPLPTPEMKTNYINFYGNLMKLIDGHIQSILDVFESGPTGAELRANTWIVRTADHGEMGMAHGGLRQKNFNVYEETIRVPMIWSNPVAYPTGEVCEELVSHVDWLPTVCGLLGVPGWQQYQFAGIDYSSLIRHPDAGPVQEYILFTFDDIWSGQDAAGNPNGVVPPPNRIEMIFDKESKYARYFDGEGVVADQQEFYDIRKFSAGGTDTDPITGLPIELKNFSEWAQTSRVSSSVPPLTMSPELVLKRTQMANALPAIVSNRLQPRPPTAAVPPENLEITVVDWIDDDSNPQSETQIFWVSSYVTQYQLQSSSDAGATWTNVGGIVEGSNGPMVILQPVSAVQYRLLWEARGTIPPEPTPETQSQPPATTTQPPETAQQPEKIAVYGPSVRNTSGSIVVISGASDSPTKALQYRLGANGQIKNRYITHPNWKLTIRGLQIGRNSIFFRQVDRNGMTGEWTRIVVIRR
ncbi:MAG: sulfatase-like hydrolase/transferase [Chthoniobacterales bacterium]